MYASKRTVLVVDSSKDKGKILASGKVEHTIKHIEFIAKERVILAFQTFGYIQTFKLRERSMSIMNIFSCQSPKI